VTATGSPVPADAPVRTASLRLRVTLWVLLVLVGLIVSLGFAVNWILGDALRDDLRQRLADRASYAGVLQANGVSGQNLADELAGQGILSTYTSGDNQYIGRETGRPPGGPGGRPSPRAPAVEPKVAISESDTEMTAEVTLTGGTLVLRAGEFEIDRTLAELRRIELIAGGATVLVAALLLIRVVGVALRPLDRMTVLARRIRDGARGRRLRPTRPGTDLGRTASAFDEMLDALEAAELAAQRAEEQMRVFLADASHDLRTPLAGVIAGAERLLRDPDGERFEREERLVQLVRQAQRAARLVDDLLLMTRLDEEERSAGHLPAGRETRSTGNDQHPVPTWGVGRRVVDPVALIHREVQALALRCPGLAITVEAGPFARHPGRALADPDQLQRAFGNVLDNAGKAAGPTGRVHIRLALDHGFLVTSVEDDGPGVPAQDVDRIFDRFVRLSGARTGPGSGLGLPISRSILRADGGDLWCAPSAVGALFVARLPLLEVPTDMQGYGWPEPAGAHSPHDDRPKVQTGPGPTI